jgi:FkbM family methyltransferase
MLHYVRHCAHPDVPLEQKVAKVHYDGRTASLRIRRWSGWDALAIRQCFDELQYDMPDGAQGAAVKKTYQAIVASGRKPLIIDCGANIGASVRWFAMWYPEAHVIAIEPAPDNFALLRQNTKGLDVDVRHAAIGASDGVAFLVNPRGGDAEMAWQVTSEPSELSVQVLSVKTLLAEKPIDRYVPFLLKIDIEGGEKALFAGDTSAIDLFPLIMMEPHDWMCPGEMVSREFFRFHVDAGREFAMKHENVASLALHRNIK